MQTTAVSRSDAARVAVLPAGDFVVGEWLVEPDLDRISRNGVSAHLRPKLMDLLVYLARHAGRTLPHDELLANVWPDQPFIVGTALPRCIAELRQGLGDHAAGSTLIQTIPKRGYRLIAAVRPAADVPPAADVEAGRPRQRRSAPRAGGSTPSWPPLPPMPTPEPLPVGPSRQNPVLVRLLRARLVAGRLWRSFRSRGG